MYHFDERCRPRRALPATLVLFLTVVFTGWAATSARADFVRGDASSDGTINLVDAIFALNYMALGGEAPQCLEAADVNDSGTINVVDAVHLLAYFFAGGPPPPPPFPGCGSDPTADALDCATPSAGCP